MKQNWVHTALPADDTADALPVGTDLDRQRQPYKGGRRVVFHHRIQWD